MERVAGIPLGAVWHGMGFKDRVAILKTIAEYQKSWMSTGFTQFGSIYYAGDESGSNQSLSYTNPDGAMVTDPKFSFGPSTARCINDDGRATVDFDRGPCSSIISFACVTANVGRG